MLTYAHVSTSKRIRVFFSDAPSCNLWCDKKNTHTHTHIFLNTCVYNTYRLFLNGKPLLHVSDSIAQLQAVSKNDVGLYSVNCNVTCFIDRCCLRNKFSWMLFAKQTLVAPLSLPRYSFVRSQFCFWSHLKSATVGCLSVTYILFKLLETFELVQALKWIETQATRLGLSLKLTPFLCRRENGLWIEDYR
jgi:hypothetical protein